MNRRQLLKSLALLSGGIAVGSLMERVKSVSAQDRTRLSKYFRLPASVIVFRDGDYAVAVDRKGNVISRSTEHSLVWKEAINAIHPVPDGEIRVINGSGHEYITSESVEIPSGVIIMNSKFKLDDNANCDIVKSIDFDSLTGQNKWYVDTDGVPYRFGLINVHIDGNKANNTAGSGIKFYGKAYILLNVLVRDCAEYGLYSECGDVVGQHDWRDAPEIWVDWLVVRNCNLDGILYRGPHDAVFNRVFVLGNGGAGLKNERSAGVYSGGIGDIIFLHAYGNDIGVDVGDVLRASFIESESNNSIGLRVTNGAARISYLHVFNNPINVKLETTHNMIDMLFCYGQGKTATGTIGVDIVANDNRIGLAHIYNCETGLQVRRWNIIRARIYDCSTGVKLGTDTTPAHNILDLVMSGCNTYIDIYGTGYGNFVRMTCYTSAGETVLSGTYSDDDRIDIIARGAVVGRTINKGIATFSGDGSTTTFNIPHGLLSAPSVYNVSPLTPDADAPRTVTADASNIIITYSTAPPSGTDNLKFYWEAKV